MKELRKAFKQFDIGLTHYVAKNLTLSEIESILATIPNSDVYINALRIKKNSKK